MQKKRNTSPIALIERAVVVATANARLPGWRQAQMKVFAHRFGEYPIPERGVDLERECARIVRTAGYRYARKLLNWFIAVKQNVEVQPTDLAFPIGIPKQPASEATSQQAYKKPMPAHYRRHIGIREKASQIQHHLM